MTEAANYTADRTTVEGMAVVRLADTATGTEVWIAPSMGNNAYQMKVKGTPIFWSPYKTLAEWKAKPVQLGNPLLAPWANRIDQNAYYANGKKYLLNAGLNNFRKDANQFPIHGLLVFASEWEVTNVSADERGAYTTSRIEFWRNPDWMAQFPFAHTMEMTHRLRDGALEVETMVENLSSQPMPVSLGYHTYYQITDVPRDAWQVEVAAKENVVLSNVLVPTGETRPVTLAHPLKLEGTQLDDVFTALVRGTDGRAIFSVKGKRQKIDVEYGPLYTVSVVYAPKGRDFICFEPMSGVTNAFNLGYVGKFPLQTIPVGGRWRESFWIRPSGF
ncbi:MAG: aldose 1-epimerase [Acidobacteriia bacterium]|nr:aldose 1-epimerase [Terriglobia bacterium]